MTREERIAIVERKIENRKEMLKTLTNPSHIEQCKLDIEQFTELLEFEKKLA